jgi:bacterioferritin
MAASEPQQGVTRDQLVQGLQDDLAREYKAIIQYVVYSQALDEARYMDIAEQLEKHAHQELEHALAVARQLDYFGAYPAHEPKPVPVSATNEDMLWFDLQAEDDTVQNYRERIRQAQALGEFALAEALQEIVREEQDHQIDLATALGAGPSAPIATPPVEQPRRDERVPSPHPSQPVPRCVPRRAGGTDKVLAGLNRASYTARRKRVRGSVCVVTCRSACPGETRLRAGYTA